MHFRCSPKSRSKLDALATAALCLCSVGADGGGRRGAASHERSNERRNCAQECWIDVHFGSNEHDRCWRDQIHYDSYSPLLCFTTLWMNLAHTERD
jgi:hypothetical protein